MTETLRLHGKPYQDVHCSTLGDHPALVPEKEDVGRHSAFLSKPTVDLLDHEAPKFLTQPWFPDSAALAVN